MTEPQSVTIFFTVLLILVMLQCEAAGANSQTVKDAIIVVGWKITIGVIYAGILIATWT